MGIMGKRHCKIWSLLSRTLARSFLPSADEARTHNREGWGEVADSNFSVDPAKAACGREASPLGWSGQEGMGF